MQDSSNLSHASSAADWEAHGSANGFLWNLGAERTRASENDNGLSEFLCCFFRGCENPLRIAHMRFRSFLQLCSTPFTSNFIKLFGGVVSAVQGPPALITRQISHEPVWRNAPCQHLIFSPSFSTYDFGWRQAKGSSNVFHITSFEEGWQNLKIRHEAPPTWMATSEETFWMHHDLFVGSF